MWRTPRFALFPYTTLFRSERRGFGEEHAVFAAVDDTGEVGQQPLCEIVRFEHPDVVAVDRLRLLLVEAGRDRKSTRLNSSHVRISYAVFCLKKKSKLRYIP